LAVIVSLSKRQRPCRDELLARRVARGTGIALWIGMGRATAAKRAIAGEIDLDLVTDPQESARAAGLRYMMDDGPGITRRRKGSGFTYLAPDGARITDEAELARIRALAIPPAWTDVWIAPSSRGHIQATGRDARGRKQYRYHEKWRCMREETKFSRMALFGAALPTIRERVDEHLALPGLPREKVLALVVSLLEQTMIRVGNEEYARSNRSYGLTTLRDRHVDISGSRARFRFRGKSGVAHDVEITDRRLARVVRRCQEVPGQELFQYIDDEGEGRTIGSADVNDYLRELGGDEFTAKDFRTWGGTVSAAVQLRESGECETLTERRARIVETIRTVASTLGNTPAVCRKSYVHPVVITRYEDGSLCTLLDECAAATKGMKVEWMSDDELMVLELLHRALEEPAS
jgi:DNA topoisomerase I